MKVVIENNLTGLKLTLKEDIIQNCGNCIYCKKRLLSKKYKCSVISNLKDLNLKLGCFLFEDRRKYI